MYEYARSKEDKPNQKGGFQVMPKSYYAKKLLNYVELRRECAGHGSRDSLVLGGGGETN